MKKLILEIKAEMTKLEDKLAKSFDYVKSIVEAIEKMGSDKITASNEANIISGALQAYRNVVSEYEKIHGVVEEVEDVSEAVLEGESPEAIAAEVAEAVGAVTEVVS